MDHIYTAIPGSDFGGWVSVCGKPENKYVTKNNGYLYEDGLWLINFDAQWIQQASPDACACQVCKDNYPLAAFSVMEL